MADSKVKDMGLAEFGRKELDLAEHEMPGLMSARKEFGPGQPFKCLNIHGSLRVAIQTGVLIETLAALGAKVRWCSCDIFSTQDHAAAAIAKAGTATVFAWKGETLKEYWWCTEQMMTVPGADGCGQLVAATAMSARAAPSPCAVPARASSSPRSTPSAPSRLAWRASRWSRSSPWSARSTFAHDRQQGHHPARAHEEHEEQRHRGQHRPLRQRDRRGRVGEVRRHKVENIKAQVDRYVFPDGHGVIILAAGRLLNLGCATGHPSFVMSCSFANQVVAQLDILKNWKENKGYKNQAYLLPKELGEKVARLRLGALGAVLAELTDDQAKYIGVGKGGPYKPDAYRN